MRVVVALMLCCALAGSARAAEIQKSGSEVWPGKFMVGFHPIGGQAAFDGFSTGGYKLSADFSGLIKPMDKVTLWVGGGFGYTYPIYTCGYVVNNGAVVAGGCAHNIQLIAFVTITMEKLLNIPLVPFVRAGLGGDILAYPSNAGTYSGGAFDFRVGGGIHYFLLKQLGLGLETNFTFGPGFFPAIVTNNGNTGTVVGFFGNWDVGLGAIYAF
jgi:hypothetical protein